MAGTFEAYREDGLLLYDTAKISYGLLKSGYLASVTSWPRLDLRSAQLDPSDPSSWRESSEADPILGFSISGAVAPIVFITGRGSACGSSKSGDVTTFFFTAATTDTKFYCFDTMRDDGLITGMKHFREQDGVLTFNSGQPPLIIAASVSPPEPGPILFAGTTYRGNPYAGGSGAVGPATPGGPENKRATFKVALQAGVEYAAYISFARTAAYGSDPNRYLFLVALQEGAYGVQGGVEFMFSVAARATKLPQQRTALQSYQTYIDVPTDRYPIALAIKTSSYPFPFK